GGDEDGGGQAGADAGPAPAERRAPVIGQADQQPVAQAGGHRYVAQRAAEVGVRGLFGLAQVPALGALREMVRQRLRLVRVELDAERAVERGQHSRRFTIHRAPSDGRRPGPAPAATAGRAEMPWPAPAATSPSRSGGPSPRQWRGTKTLRSKTRSRVSGRSRVTR